VVHAVVNQLLDTHIDGRRNHIQRHHRGVRVKRRGDQEYTFHAEQRLGDAVGVGQIHLHRFRGAGAAGFIGLGRIVDDAPDVDSVSDEGSHDVMASYLVYVLNKHHQDAIAAIADRLAGVRNPNDLPILYAATDALLENGQASAAADLWQALGHAPPHGVTYSDFEEPRIGHGFDWRFAEPPGVTHLPIESPAAHRIRFSGQQPESTELLRQVLGGLHPGVSYTLHWDARTQGIASPTGLEWRIAGKAAPVLADDDWSTGQMVFTADSDHPVLVLAYRRPEGQVRTQGQVDLKKVFTSSPE